MSSCPPVWEGPVCVPMAERTEGRNRRVYNQDTAAVLLLVFVEKVALWSILVSDRLSLETTVTWVNYCDNCHHRVTLHLI